MEPTRHMGGLVTSGLSHIDFRTYEGLGGLFLDFARRVEALRHIKITMKMDALHCRTVEGVLKE